MQKTPDGDNAPRVDYFGTSHLPDIEQGEDLITHLNSIGFCSRQGEYLAGVTHQEIAAWMRNTGTQLNAWEAETLHKLSSVYANWAMRSRDPKCEPPFDIEHRKILALRVQDQIFR